MQENILAKRFDEKLLRLRTGCWLCFLVFVLSCSPHAECLAPLASVEPSGWERVVALSAGSRIRIASDTRNATCFVVTVSDAALTCSHSLAASGRPLVFLRPEIRNIKLSRKGHSATVGLLIGLGAGAGIGAGIGVAVNSGDTGSFLHNSSGAKPAAVGAVLGALVLGGTGAGIGYATDLFAGPLFYRR